MKITNLLFWVQENKLSEKFYRKLGFEVTRSEGDMSVVALGGFEIWLVNVKYPDNYKLCFWQKIVGGE